MIQTKRTNNEIEKLLPEELSTGCYSCFCCYFDTNRQIYTYTHTKKVITKALLVTWKMRQTFPSNRSERRNLMEGWKPCWNSYWGNPNYHICKNCSLTRQQECLQSRYCLRISQQDSLESDQFESVCCYQSNCLKKKVREKSFTLKQLWVDNTNKEFNDDTEEKDPGIFVILL